MSDPIYDRNAVIQTIHDNLKRRSAEQGIGIRWSVTGGRGTAYGWIKITARNATHRMNVDERVALGKLLGLFTLPHYEGIFIPGCPSYRREYLDRSAGVKPAIFGGRYWD